MNIKSFLNSVNPNPKTLKSDAIAGFATGLFSIPEGMAYAQLAGVNPLYGMYSGTSPRSLRVFVNRHHPEDQHPDQRHCVVNGQRHANSQHSKQPDARRLVYHHVPGRGDDVDSGAVAPG
ncbi:MAG: SulP family inorganic anion transporter [Caldilineales bacterium]